MQRKNRNRGYRSLRVWQHAIELDGDAYRACSGWPYELNKLASQTLASVDSVHRNIAEGYCRRSAREDSLFRNYALGSLGETASAIEAYKLAGHLSHELAEKLDEKIFQVENELLNLQDAIVRKNSEPGVVREQAAAYAGCSDDVEIFLSHVIPEAPAIASFPNTPTPQHPSFF